MVVLIKCGYANVMFSNSTVSNLKGLGVLVVVAVRRVAGLGRGIADPSKAKPTSSHCLLEVLANYPSLLTAAEPDCLSVFVGPTCQTLSSSAHGNFAEISPLLTPSFVWTTMFFCGSSSRGRYAATLCDGLYVAMRCPSDSLTSSAG